MSILKDILSIGRSKVVIILFGLGKAIIIARVLGPELNGFVAGLVVYPSLFMTIGALGVRKSSAFLLANGKFSEDQIKTGIIHAWVLSVVLSMISIVILLTQFSKTDYTWLVIGLALAPIPFSLFKTYVSGLYLGNNNIREFNKVDWLPAVVSFFSTAIFVWLIPMSVNGVLLAEIIGPLVMALILAYRQNIHKAISFNVNIAVLKSLFTLGFAYAISLVIINLNYRIDIVIMEWVSTKYQMGIYSKGSALTQYLWHVPMMLGTVVFARGVRAVDKKVFSIKVCQLLRISLVITLVGSIFLALLANQIILILFGNDFLPSADVMIWLLPGVFLLIIFKVLNMDVGSQGKPWFSLKAMIPALIINVILNLYLVPIYGAIGAAISSTVSYTSGAIIFLLMYSNFTGLSLKQIFAFSKSDFQFLMPYWQKIKTKI